MNFLRFCAVVLSVFPIIGIQSKLYTTKNNRTYYIEENYLYTWYDAHLECSARDMALLTLESREKFDDIYQLLKSGQFSDSPPYLWVGAIGINRKFAWTLTGKPIIPSMWCNICPNNHPSDENCVQFWGNEHGLNDLNCSSKNGFICEDRVQWKECEENKSCISVNIIQNN